MSDGNQGTNISKLVHRKTFACAVLLYHRTNENHTLLQSMNFFQTIPGFQLENLYKQSPSVNHCLNYVMTHVKNYPFS